MNLRTILPILFVLLCSVNIGFSQLSLNPQSVFLNPDTRSGSMEITNVSDDNRQITIYFKFGYLSFDSLGNSQIVYDDTLSEKVFSIAPYIKAYPSKLVIPPRETQTVRFIANNVGDLPDKVYWARLFVKSSPIIEQIDTVTEGKVSAQVVFETEMGGIIVYQKGKTSADAEIDYKKATIDSLGLTCYWDLVKSGNSPFWGTMQVQLFDGAGDYLDETSVPLAFYKDGTFKCLFKEKKYQPGKYKAIMTITNERADIPEDRWINYKKQTKEFEFIVN